MITVVRTITGFKAIFLFLLVSSLFTMNVEAAQTGDEEAIRDIKRKQLEIEEKLREKERRKQEQDGQEKENEKESTDEGGNRFRISEIIIQNTELLSNRKKNKIITQFLNKELNHNDINNLAAKITNTLVEDGYVTTRVKVPLDQNLKSGKLLLTIVNGYIEDIVTEEESIRRGIQLFFVLPFFKDRILDINDLDYGIEQMNRLESNNASMKILPGEELGASKIMIYNDPGFLLKLEGGTDNLGQESTGEYRRKVSASADNLISINDNSQFNYTDGWNTDTKNKYSRCFTGYIAFPLGYWTFSYTYSYSEYLQHIKGLNDEIKFAGKDASSIYSIDRILWKYKIDSIKGKIVLTLKDKKSYIQDVKIDASSYKLAVAEGGLNYNGYLFGGFFSYGMYYDRGLEYFNAEKDISGMADDIPRAQFEKYKVDLFWNRPLYFFNQSFGYSININGQYSMNSLYSSEQISIGDLYSVRGFKNYSASGDNGYCVRNEISVNDFSRFWRYLRGVKIFAGYDYGFVIHKTGKDANNGQGKANLSGISTGLSYASSVFNSSLTCGWKLKAPGFIKEDDYVIYWTFTMNFTNLFEETSNIF
jgi:hemolysin activation/secretion protein